MTNKTKTKKQLQNPLSLISGSNHPPHPTTPFNSAKTDIPTAITFITTVRPYVEPYVEPLLWRGVSWVLGDAERPSDAIREVEKWKEQEKDRESQVMQGLRPYMYHERQEPGSMMCGQHALNSLLQGNYFTPPDLAQIAHELDQLEQGVQASRGEKSTNMDDTGYFSLQVLENALKNAFGLTLVRWRSEEMRPYQAVPDTQLAFVLNLEQHWFTLRRFGQPGRKGHWFNLNSFLESPEWVGNTYLGMVLQQAEKEGYSVFVVRPVDPSNPENMLPETEADLIAETLDPGDFGGQVQKISTTRTQSGPSNAITGAGSSSAPAGFENEDVELQRALQASIAAGYGGGSIYEFPDEPAASTSRPSAPPVRAPSLGLGYGGDSGPPSRRTPIPAADDPPTPQFEDDPVAASAARAKLRLEQMQREQAAAMQGLGGLGGLGGGYEVVDLDPAAAARRREAQDRVRRAREDEEEQIRRAMEASLKAHGQGEGDDLSHYDTPPTMPGAFGASGSRDYDDEDAELQAALKASLESHATSSATPAPVVPSGNAAAPRAPVPAPAAVRAPSATAPSATAPSVPALSASTAKPTEDDEDEDEEDEEEQQAPAPSSPEVEAKAEVADPDEMRRRRLARFGG